MRREGGESSASRPVTTTRFCATLALHAFWTAGCDGRCAYRDGSDAGVPGGGRGVNDLELLLATLVSLDSVNPSLVPGARGEAEIGDFVAEWLRSRGLAVE